MDHGLGSDEVMDMAQRHTLTAEAPTSSPISYAQKDDNASRLDARAGCYSGIHYQHLANFLISPYKTYGDECAIPVTAFDAVILYDLATARHHPRPAHCLCQARGFSPTCPTTALSPRLPKNPLPTLVGGQRLLLKPRGRLHLLACVKFAAVASLFFRGFPSAQWLNTVGATLDIDPEFLFRHLQTPSQSPPTAVPLDNYYATPFPESRDLIELRACNTGSWDLHHPHPALAQLRQRCNSSLQSNVQNFARSKHFVGDSVVRRFILHDLHNFSIEQKISIEVIYHTDVWSVFVWSDFGNDLGRCQHGPWVSGFPPSESTRLHPVFQHRPRMALELGCDADSANDLLRQQDRSSMPQSIQHLHKDYGQTLKPDIMATDAFYTLTKLFEFSAASIGQLFELFENTVQSVLHGLDPAALSELLMLKGFVDDYRSYLKNTLDIIEHRGGPKWPKVSEPKYRQKADRAALQLETRYRRLLARGDRVSEQCSSTTSILMNLAAQRQAEQAIARTNELGKLSVLAYFYIPLSFVSSFFGMNLVEFGEPAPSLWSFFVFSACLLALSITAWYIDIRATLVAVSRFIASWPRWFWASLRRA